MATLTDDLKAKARGIITLLEAQPNARQKEADRIAALLSMRATGVEAIIWYSGQWRDFASVIEVYRGNLHPWLTSMSAATIVWSAFMRILLVWYQAPPSAPAPLPPDAQTAIDDMIPRVVPLISAVP